MRYRPNTVPEETLAERAEREAAEHELLAGRSRWVLVKGRLNAAQKVERDAELVSWRLNTPSASWEACGHHFGISGRAVRQIWSDWRARDKSELQVEEPIDVVHEHIAGFRDLRTRAAELVFRQGVPDAVMLGALKLIADLRLRDIALRQDTGLMPANLGKLQDDLDMLFVREEIARVLIKNKVPRKDVEELVAVLKGEITRKSRDEAEIVDVEADEPAAIEA